MAQSVEGKDTEKELKPPARTCRVEHQAWPRTFAHFATINNITGQLVAGRGAARQAALHLRLQAEQDGDGGQHEEQHRHHLRRRQVTNHTRARPTHYRTQRWCL